MFTWHLNSRIVRAGLVGLLLLASVPEVRCCCDISWGAAGLFGSTAQCPERAAAPKPCCCPQQEESGDSPSTGCQDGNCDCSFCLVNPQPIVCAQGADSAPARSVDAWSLPSASLFFAENTAGHGSAAVRPPSLTPLERCAFLQTWRA